MVISVRQPTVEETLITGLALGSRIKGWRLVRGVSLDDLSDQTGIPVTTLKIYERGRRTPGGLKMLLIMNTLQLTPADLLHVDDSASANERKN